MEQKVIITGASGGFGSLICQSLIKDGHQVVGTMRSTGGKNEQIAGELRSMGVQIVTMDVTQDDSVKNAIEESLELLGGLDVVINNAGVGVFGMQEHFTPEDLQKVFDVNVFGVQRVMRATLPYLRKQGHGTILYISSLLGRMTLPFYGPYNATKWALEALAENYRTELSGFGIESLIVEPGGFATSFMDHLIRPSDDKQVDAYGEFMNVPEAMFNGFEQALENNPEQRPQKVADAVSKLMSLPFGDRPFRTIVDHMGMGEHIEKYNDHLHQLTQGIYSAFGNDHMLQLKK